MIPIIAFIIFYFIAIYSISKSYKWQNSYLVISLIVLTFLIGFRERWPDMGAYAYAFNMEPNIFEWSFDTPTYSYSEKGYHILGAIIKFFTDDVTIYFLIMGGLCMYLLNKNLKIFCLIPLLGLCDYIGRFLLNRDFTQMRSSLCILILK